jgi:hypothetical protein
MWGKQKRKEILKEKKREETAARKKKEKGVMRMRGKVEKALKMDQRIWERRMKEQE